MPPRKIGEHTALVVAGVDSHAGSGRLATDDELGEIRIWSDGSVSMKPEHVLEGLFFENGPAFDRSGNRVMDFGIPEGQGTVKLWYLNAPLEAEPLTILRDRAHVNGAVFDPSERWLATANANDGVTLWPFTHDYPIVLKGHQYGVFSLAFTPDGKRLVSGSQDGTVRVWFLEGGKPSQVLLSNEDIVYPQIDIDPSGRKLLVSGHHGKVFFVPLEEGPPRMLEGFSPDTFVLPVAFGPTGRLAAAASARGPKEEKVIRVWDLESGKSRVLGPVEGAGDLYEGQFNTLHFLPDGRLVSCSQNSPRVH